MFQMYSLLTKFFIILFAALPINTFEYPTLLSNSTGINSTNLGMDLVDITVSHNIAKISSGTVLGHDMK